MRFLVTGGAGFIGSHIAERILEAGHFVRVLDNFSSGKEENLSFVKEYGDRFELIRGDICNSATCEKATSGIDYVLHQAALRSVPKSMEEPLNYNHVNIDGTYFILQAAAKNKVKRFVFASSSSIYGDTSKFPEQEADYPLLVSPYALSKLAGEYYCRIFSEHFKLETICLRYFNVFGPRQAPDDEYSAVIPKFIHCLLNNKQPPIFGTGEQSRDFTYVENVVQANIKATLLTDVRHEVLNVACGRDNTLLNLVEILSKIMGKNIKPEFFPKRPGDVLKTLADISKAQKVLGWKSVVGFEEGLQRTINWFKSR